MKQRFVNKYMRLAKVIGEDDNPCYSRKIGVVIVDPEHNVIAGTGYNGPPPGTPHTDSAEYLKEYFWPQLTKDEKESLRLELGGLDDTQAECVHDFTPPNNYQCEKCGITQVQLAKIRRQVLNGNDTCNVPVSELFVKQYAGCKTCPRRLVKAGAGVRSELCSCGHAERHAITNAQRPLKGCEMFCWCGVPCLQCTDAIIQARISAVHCLKAGEYYPGVVHSKWLFNKAGVHIIEHNSYDVLKDSILS